MYNSVRRLQKARGEIYYNVRHATNRLSIENKNRKTLLASVFVSDVYGEDAPYLTKTDMIHVYIKIATENCGFMASSPTANRQYG